MKIPSNLIPEREQRTFEPHPQGEYIAVIEDCVIEKLEGTEHYNVNLKFRTSAGKVIAQFWNTDNLGFKIRNLRDSLGLDGDFDSDVVQGMLLDLKVFHRLEKNPKVGDAPRTWVNVDCHPRNALDTTGQEEPKLEPKLDLGSPAPSSPFGVPSRKDDVPF